MRHSAVPGISKLLLPIPQRLTPRSVGCDDDALAIEPLTRFLANGLKDSEAIERWLAAHPPIIAALPSVTESERLTPRQKIYDRYFNVERHGGSAASVAYAVGQVMSELAREFQLGSGLGQQDLHRLIDGLSAVLETVSEC